MRLVNAGRADVDLRAEPDHRARARPRDRLLAVHGLALPRGAGERGPRPPTALRATMRTAGRTVLFCAVTVAAALAALLVFRQRFLYSMGVGGVLVRADRRARVADAAAGDARRARPARERAQPAALAGGDRSATPRASASGFWYRLLAAGDAPAGADRGRRRRAADRARAAVPADQVHRRRRERAPARRAPRAWSTTRSTRVPARAQRAGLRRAATGAPPPARPRCARTRRGCREPGVGRAAAAAGRRPLADRRDRAAAGRSATQAKELVRDVRAVDAPFPVAGRRRDGGVPRPADVAGGLARRSRWRSSRRRRSSSCS